MLLSKCHLNTGRWVFDAKKRCCARLSEHRSLGALPRTHVFQIDGPLRGVLAGARILAQGLVMCAGRAQSNQYATVGPRSSAATDRSGVVTGGTANGRSAAEKSVVTTGIVEVHGGLPRVWGHAGEELEFGVAAVQGLRETMEDEAIVFPQGKYGFMYASKWTNKQSACPWAMMSRHFSVVNIQE